jgi:hypothetical protein
MLNDKGFTFYLCFGKYGGWGFKNDWPCLSLVLGWVSIGFLFRDLERFQANILEFCNNFWEEK